MKKHNSIICGMECIRFNKKRECIKTVNGTCPRCDAIAGEAVERIRKLEERNKSLEYTLLGVMHSIDKWLDVEPYDFDKDDGTEAATRAANAREVALKAIEQLKSRLAQVERERDALMLYVPRNCLSCKHEENRYKCTIPCKWEWRGPNPENTKKEK